MRADAGRQHGRDALASPFDTRLEAVGTKRELQVMAAVALLVVAGCVFIIRQITAESGAPAVLNPGGKFHIQTVKLSDLELPQPESEQKPLESREPRPVEALASEPARAVVAKASAGAQSTASAAHAASADGLNYRDRLLAHIWRYRRYPNGAKPFGLEGDVDVSFTIGEGGAVDEVQVVASSGYPALDTEAIETILRAQPLPAMPAGIDRHFTVTLDFVAP